MTKIELEQGIDELQELQQQHDMKENWDEIDWAWDEYLSSMINDYMTQLGGL